MKKVASLILVLIFFLISFPVFAQPIYTTEKLITVDIKKQTLYAWENGRIVFQTPVSTGLWQSPTVKGSFRIYSKFAYYNMRGVSPVHGYYYLPNVPSTMYFYRGYAIHGAYWHNNFGNPMSNGCVNLPLDAASWVYNWAPVGTRVEIF